jgi:ATP-dependent helicase/nuclease subunit A
MGLFTICDGPTQELWINTSIEKSLSTLQRAKNPAYLSYREDYSHTHLVQSLETAIKSDPGKQRSIAAHIKAIKELELEDEEAHIKESLDAFGSILCTVQESYSRLKNSKNTLDFDDLIQLTVTLLKKNSDLRKQVQRDIRHLLVDEFQDTDTTQWELISLLSNFQEAPTAIVFLVGDIKQSIYSFRGADPSLFTSIMNRFESSSDHHRLIKLQDNFRSNEPVIRFVNTFFSQVFATDAQFPIDYTPLTAQKSDGDSAIEFAILPKPESHAWETEAEFCVRYITTMKRKYPDLQWGDIALLFRRKQNMLRIKNHLESHQMPCQLLSDTQSMITDVFIDVVSWLKVILTPHDRVAWIRILKSPMLQFSDNHIQGLFSKGIDNIKDDVLSKIENERLVTAITQAPFQHISRALVAILESGDCDPSYTHEFRLLINELTRILRNNRDAQAHDVATLVHYLENAMKRIQKSQTSQHIQLLTIHGSKGLEYPLVIIPEAGQSFNYSASNPLLIHSKGIGISNQRSESMHRKEILNAVKRDIQEEEKRLFYVACTRAKSHLLILGSQKKAWDESKESNESYLDYIHRYCSISDENDHLLLNNEYESHKYTLYTNHILESH